MSNMSELDATSKIELANDLDKAHTLISLYDSFLTEKGLEQEFSEWVGDGIE